MRICPAHWGKLSDAIRSRGLWPLVARNGQEALQRAVDELEHKADKSSYDPLADCCWMIYGQALKMGGLYLMTGDYCPVCEAVKHAKLGTPDGFATTEQAEAHWIDGPANAVQAYVKEDPELSALLTALS